MRKLLALIVLLLTVFGLKATPAWSQDVDPKHRVLGLVRIDRHWKKILKVPVWRKSTFFYKVEGTKEPKAWPKKLRHVRDLRTYEEQHPHWSAWQTSARRWQPVVNTGAAGALPFVQGFITNRRGN
jgi:hypothetical protein